MMSLTTRMALIWAVFSLFVINESALAQGKSGDAPGRMYGMGQPKTIQDLPAGRLRKSLEGLPPKARSKALGWLQKFEFPTEDIPNIRVNETGDVAYADIFTPNHVEAPAGEGPTTQSAPISTEEAFLLHSRPGASNVLYLDFDGHNFADTAWGSGEYSALPFDPSKNDSPPEVANFTQDELTRIHEIWHRIAEDYAPFNIDVTTEEPDVFTSTTGHLLFTHDTDSTGRAMPHQGVGGVAYVNVFGNSEYVSRYSPTLVYYTNLSTSSHGLPNYTADAASHEFGHNVGLGHDGIAGGTSYYQGHGTGLVSWAPIMGMLYYNNVTQWSKGEYANANLLQDDIAIIAGDLGYVSDDHGESAETATALLVEADGNILVSNPELDPENLLPKNKGIIDDRNDVDWFYLDVNGPGTVTIAATPAWHAFPRTEKRGANLDIELSIFDSNLDLVGFSEPDDNTDAASSFSVSAGRYFIQVDGVGTTANSDYSDYASLGMYFLEGFVDASVTQPEIDTKPPSPSTMSWQSSPAATGETTIQMTAVEATDESGIVEYYFTCVAAGGAGCVDSGWQSSRTYTAAGLTPETYYEFKVMARDNSDNQNSASSSMGDTTDAPPPVYENQAPVAVASYSAASAVITKGKNINVTLDGSGSSDPDGTIVNWTWKNSSGSTVGEGATITPRLKEGTFTYTLTVTDNAGATDSATLSVVVTRGGGDDGSTGGNKGKKPPKG